MLRHDSPPPPPPVPIAIRFGRLLAKRDQLEAVQHENLMIGIEIRRHLESTNAEIERLSNSMRGGSHE